MCYLLNTVGDARNRASLALWVMPHVEQSIEDCNQTQTDNNLSHDTPCLLGQGMGYTLNSRSCRVLCVQGWSVSRLTPSTLVAHARSLRTTLLTNLLDYLSFRSPTANKSVSV